MSREQPWLNASNGVLDPWGFAFWSYFGKTHKKGMLIWAERSRQTQQALERCAVMAKPQTLYATALAALPPKKPSHSVRPQDTRKAYPRAA